MNNWQTFTKGFFKENPTFVLLLGMCPTLGVTTSAINGLGMLNEQAVVADRIRFGIEIPIEEIKAELAE